MKNENRKIPIDEYGEGNCCPECGSLQISRIDTCQLEREIDLRTEKEIFRKLDGTRISKPSNRVLAWAYNRYRHTEFWSFRCRKCGWESEIMHE